MIIISVDRKGVPSLQFGSLAYGQNMKFHVPNCKFGTPLAIFYKLFNLLNISELV